MNGGDPDVILRVNQLNKRYRGVHAVRNASLSVRRGEVLGLIGPNGSGKTTLFGCLGGILPYESGSIEVFTDTGRPALFYLPDAISPWPEQSVAWALQFAEGFFHARGAISSEWAASLGLAPILASPIGALSKGQRKRALLAIALTAPHPILLLDEPFDGLDLRQTREIASLLRLVAATGRTLFLSIHQIAEAARVCDRFVLLSEGTVRGEGTFEQLAARMPQGNSSDADTLENVFLALT